MKVDKDFALTTPSEMRDLGFDFSNDLADVEGVVEKISSATFTLEIESTDDGKTVDASPNTRKSGAASIEDSAESAKVDAVAVQRVTGMTDGNVYRVICRATTTNGQVLELYGVIACRVAA